MERYMDNPTINYGKKGMDRLGQMRFISLSISKIRRNQNFGNNYSDYVRNKVNQRSMKKLQSEGLCNYINKIICFFIK